MQANFVDWLGAFILSWVHYFNVLLHIFKSNRAAIYLHLYVFGLLFPSIHKVLLPEVMVWRHAAHANLFRSVAKIEPHVELLVWKNASFSSRKLMISEPLQLLSVKNNAFLTSYLCVNL